MCGNVFSVMGKRDTGKTSVAFMLQKMIEGGYSSVVGQNPPEWNGCELYPEGEANGVAAGGSWGDAGLA